MAYQPWGSQPRPQQQPQWSQPGSLPTGPPATVHPGQPPRTAYEGFTVPGGTALSADQQQPTPVLPVAPPQFIPPNNAVQPVGPPQFTAPQNHVTGSPSLIPTAPQPPAASAGDMGQHPAVQAPVSGEFGGRLQGSIGSSPPEFTGGARLPGGPGSVPITSPFAVKAGNFIGQAAANRLGLSEQLVGSVVQTGVSTVLQDVDQQTRQVRAWLPQTLLFLRRYFNVSHGYVTRKVFSLLLPLVPLTQMRRRRRSGSEGDRAGSSHQLHASFEDKAQEPAVLRDGSLDSVFRELDLYVPLMAFVTYILACGLTKGTLDDFHPEVLSSTLTFAGLLLLAEVLVVIGVCACYDSSRSSIHLGPLDFICVCGYKYVHLCFIVFVGLLTGGEGTLFYCAFFLGALSAALATFLTIVLRSRGEEVGEFLDWGVRRHNQHNRSSVIVAVYGLSQIPLCWLLSPSWNTAPRSFFSWWFPAADAPK